MATIGRKQPVAPPPQTPKSRAAAATVDNDNSAIGRLRRTVRDITAELRKVTWPTPEETRNLTIVVIGISAVLGAVLASVDFVLSYLYRLINP